MRALNVPVEVQKEINEGAAIAISISGGKDSQALLKAVVHYLRANQLPNTHFAIHANLGRTEWEHTAAHCQKICDDLDVPLVVVQREKGDLLARWEERMEKLKGTGKPFWSSAKNRYCTSDLKRGPINTHLRKYKHIISVEGVRADESPARAKKPVFSIREGITTKTRKAFSWNAIFDWKVADVWGTYGNSDNDLQHARLLWETHKEISKLWYFHPAYAMGNQRLSCALCILGSKNDLVNGIRHNPTLANQIEKMEIESGFTFRSDISITELKKLV